MLSFHGTLELVKQCTSYEEYKIRMEQYAKERALIQHICYLETKDLLTQEEFDWVKERVK